MVESEIKRACIEFQEASGANRYGCGIFQNFTNGRQLPWKKKEGAAG
jgi:hypothetical protein